MSFLRNEICLSLPRHGVVEVTDKALGLLRSAPFGLGRYALRAVRRLSTLCLASLLRVWIGLPLPLQMDPLCLDHYRVPLLHQRLRQFDGLDG